MKKISARLKREPHLLYLLFVPIFLICFFSLEKLVGPDKPYWSVHIPADDAIPFVEYFVVPYYLWYPFLAATGLLLLLRDVPNFRRYMQFLSFGFGAALLFCLLVPNGQDLRPESFERDNVFTALVGLMYRMDTNTNVFPSMHVIGSAAAAIAVWKSREMRGLRLPWTILAVLISASTVFIKQHSMLDLIGGLVFCLPLYAGIYLRKKQR